MSQGFKDLLNDIMDKLEADRPEHALPYGTWVKSFRDHNLWGVVLEAKDATEDNKDYVDGKMCTYMVQWLNNGTSKKKKNMAYKTTVESDFSLIVPLDEQGKPFVFQTAY